MRSLMLVLGIRAPAQVPGSPGNTVSGNPPTFFVIRGKEFLPERRNRPLPGRDHAVRKCAGVQGNRGGRQCFRAWPSGTPPVAQ